MIPNATTYTSENNSNLLGIHTLSCIRKTDVEQLISLIYVHKCLWDESDSSYHLRDLNRIARRETFGEWEYQVNKIIIILLLSYYYWLLRLYMTNI